MMAEFCQQARITHARSRTHTENLRKSNQDKGIVMRFLDAKLTRNKLRYVAQCLLAALSIFVVLLILDAKSNAAVLAALGASSFIVFTMPNERVSRSRYLIGGYAVGIVAGFLCFHLSQLPFWEKISLVPPLSSALFSALAVGLAIFLMVITDLEHPPAAGVALGLVLNEANQRTILVVLIGIILLVLIKRVIRPLLIDLL